MRRVWMAVATAMVVAGPVRADTKAGVEAWQRGDYRSAVEEWRKAARNGDADAEYNLGQAYKMGRGVPVDLAAAESWYGKAAAQGHVEAEDNYGLALFQNNHTRDAIPHLEKSVVRGEPRAQYILGTMLFNGVDIKKDWPRAYALTSRAAAAGLPQATQSLQQMDGFLSTADRQQGLAMADRMAADQLPAKPVGEVIARSGPTGLRGVDLPPSDVVRQPPLSPKSIKPVSRATPVKSGRWRLQLGAFGDAGNAHKLGAQVAGRFPGHSVDYTQAGALTRVLVGPFASKSEAAAACGSLKPCVPVAP